MSGLSQADEGRQKTMPATLASERAVSHELFDGRFLLEATLATGAMGTVYRAIDLDADDRLVALKVLHPQAASDSAMRARFEREAALASKLDHPHCVKVLGWGRSGEGVHYIVMELVDGRELRSHLREALAPREALDILIDLLRALEHCHARGVIHRDVKPENIILSSSLPRRLVLIDFGVTCGIGCSGATLTERGTLIGTPQYMSPEQAAGKDILDGRCDLYAAGIIFYEMLVGRRPFAGSDIEELLRMQQVAKVPPLPAMIPRYVSRLLRRLVAKSPSRRFANASEALAEALEVRRRYDQRARATSSWSQTWSQWWAERRPWVAAAGFVGVGLLLGVGAPSTPSSGDAASQEQVATTERGAEPQLEPSSERSAPPPRALRVASRSRNVR